MAWSRVIKETDLWCVSEGVLDELVEVHRLIPGQGPVPYREEKAD